jgi:ADP-ribose pyrophosphatase YjhB (NUDIX family)
MITNKAAHFCAGIRFIRQENGRYLIVGLVKKRYKNDVCLPGGTNEHAPWEDKEKTLIREFSEETELTPTSFRLVHVDEKPGHNKYFFVILATSGNPSYPKFGKERDGEETVVDYWDLEKFEKQLFFNHYPAFMKACAVLAKIDPSFIRNYPEICRKLEERH